ncbi:hypothetical protein [Salegentibacter sp. 24]|jgi:hypothetical protein|nr:hypothetical protein [Salegentibacter sp. 24]
MKRSQSGAVLQPWVYKCCLKIKINLVYSMEIATKEKKPSIELINFGA